MIVSTLGRNLLVHLFHGSLAVASFAITVDVPAEDKLAIGWAANAEEAGKLGLYPAADFRLVDGKCIDCSTIPQALWYFRNDIVGVPGKGVPAAGFTPRVRAQEDVRHWYRSVRDNELHARSPLVWIGASRVVGDVRLNATGDAMSLPDGRVIPFRVVPKISTNLSYYDSSSAGFFRERPLRMRGELKQGADGRPVWEARTIWPQDWSINEKKMTLRPLAAGETLASLVRQHESAKDERYEVRLLWERKAAENRDWSRHAVMALMLNGAQGDDDESHGGHFAIATGHHGGGEWSDWMVNNFYNLSSFSEKGIVASMLPMDNYLADLNSGQSYYRPSYMLVAVLRSDRAAQAYQGAISRVYSHFYRQDFRYHHAGANCAGISIDTLRSLGWDVPAMGPSSVIKALAAYPYMALKDRSFESGKKAYDYMIEEQSRLYPALAFDALGKELFRLAGNPAAADAGPLEKILKEDLEALVFVRIPQIPSSRAFGSFPAFSIDEYLARVPEDKSDWKIVPVEPRPFPPELMDSDTLRDEPLPPSVPALATLLLLAGGIYALSRRLLRRRV